MAKATINGTKEPRMGVEVTRRQMFALSGVSMLGLAACADGNGSQTNDSAFFNSLPQSDLGADPIQFQQFDSGDRKGKYFNAFFDAYSDQHEQFSVDYRSGSWDTLQEALTLALRNGTEPDLFNLPPSVTMDEAVDRGWIAAFDDVIDNFGQLRESLPPGTFLNGITDIEGKTYRLPLTSSRRLNSLLMYNTEYMDRVDEDPTQILEWDDFRRIARKITDDGDGDYYGLIFSVGQADRLSRFVSTLAEMAGLHGGAGRNWVTGEFNFTDPLVEEAMEFLIALNQDGCIVPGVAGMNAAEASSRFPQGAAGMLFEGAWVTGEWLDEDPDLPMGLNILPQRDRNNIWPQSQTPGGTNLYVVSAQSEHTQVINDIWHYLFSEEGQMAFASIVGAADTAHSETAIAEAEMHALDERAYELYREYTVVGPNANLRTDEVQRFQSLQNPVSPGFSDVCVGLFTGQLTDIRKEFRDLQARSERDFEDTLQRAQSEGVDVTEDTWIFPDWNPREDYVGLEGS